MADAADERLDAIAELGRLLLDDGDVDQTLQRVVDTASHAIGGCDMASVTLLRGTKPATVVFTEPAVPEMDAVQYAAGDGPCLDAMRELRTVRFDASRAEPRWSAFTGATRAQGVLSALALPLIVRGEATGALNLYAEATDAFDASAEAFGELLARQASVTLANAKLYQTARDAMAHLEEALATRDVIGQAKGILMNSFGLTAEQAFDRLRHESQTRNIKLRELADRIAYTGAMPESLPPTNE